jgi:uncharacterized membrane protein
MPKRLLPYLAVLGALVLLDVAWLGGIAMPTYQRGIGHLMAAQPNLAAAALFYVLYAAGVTIFVVRPRAPGDRLGAAGWGALFGFMAFMTYDLTNLATLRDWPVALSALDVAWGCLSTAIAASIGKVAADRRA